MLHNWKSYATRLQSLSILLAIFLAPSNLFFQLLPHSGYVHGLQIDYLIPKLFATDLLMLSSLLLELIKNQETIKHKILRACTQCVHNLQLTTFSSQHRKNNNITTQQPDNSHFSILHSCFSILTFSLYLLSFTYISSQLFTPFPLVSLWTIARLGLFVAFFFLVKNSKSISGKSVVNTFLFSVSIQALWGIGQFFLQRSLTPYWLLGETQLYNQPMLSRADFSWLDKLIGTNFGLRVLPYGLTPHPNVLAGFLVLGIIIFIEKIKNQKLSTNQFSILRSQFSILSSPPSAIRSQFSILDSQFSFLNSPFSILTFAFFLLPFSFVALFLTQSLSAWMALGLFVIFFRTFPHFYKYSKIKSQTSKRFKNLKLKIKNSSAFLLATSYFLLTFLIPFLLSRLTTSNYQIPGMDHLSLTRRVELNQSAWKMFEKNPIFGVGLGQFTSQVEDYSSSKEVVNFIQPAHHVGLLFLAENGLVGIALLLLLIVFIVKKIKTYNLSLAAYPLLFPFSFYLLPLLTFDHYLYSLNQGWWMIWIFAFMLTLPIDKSSTFTIS